MMRPIIEFCNSNMSLGTYEIMKKLESNPDYDVVEYGCLGNCGQCFYTPYAMLNGEVIEAPTAEELYVKIIEAINETTDSNSWVDDIE